MNILEQNNYSMPTILTSFEMSVDKVQGYLADILVDQTVEIEVKRVGAGPYQVTEYVVIRVKILDTCNLKSTIPPITKYH